MKWGTRVHQPEVCKINSDREFFQLLRQSYYEQRGKSSWTRFRTVKALKFVQVGYAEPCTSLSSVTVYD
jgi:hypothetical protein